MTGGSRAASAGHPGTIKGPCKRRTGREITWGGQGGKSLGEDRKGNQWERTGREITGKEVAAGEVDPEADVEHAAEREGGVEGAAGRRGAAAVAREARPGVARRRCVQDEELVPDIIYIYIYNIQLYI